MGLEKRWLLRAVFQIVGPAFTLGAHAIFETGFHRLAIGLLLPVVVFAAHRAHGQLARHRDLGLAPGGVHHAQIGALEGDRQGAEQLHDLRALRLVRAMVGGVFFVVASHPFVEEPARAIFGIFAQQVDFVIAQHGHGAPGLDQLFGQRKHGGAVGPAIAEIAHEHQSAPLRMLSLRVVAEMLHQLRQGVKLTVNIANDVQWTLG